MKRLLIFVTVTILLTNCGGSSPNPQIQQQLRDAVSANDLKAINEVLSKGAEPDQAQETSRTALILAGEMVANAEGPVAARKSLSIFQTLCRHIRHRNNKTVEIEDNLKVIFSGVFDPGGLHTELQVNLEDGKSYPLALSMDETTYKNTLVNDGVFLILVKEKYKIRGIVLNGIFEAEEIELLKDVTGDKPADEEKDGMLYSVPHVLPSTEKALIPFLKLN